METTSDPATTLREVVRGAVLTPSDPGYDEARAVWNAMIDRRPAAIVRPLDVDDVQAAVRGARALGLPISVRGGGHNVAGHAVGDGAVMIDLGLLRTVGVDRERRIARVGGGATWAEVDAAAQGYGLATPGGLISETGVGGLLLNGGIGWLRSRHGLSVDNLVAADVVVADGRLVRASDDERPDLLWALRGGGGNFGIVVSFELALHPVGPMVAFAGPVYPIEAGGGPIRAWRDLVATRGNDIASLVEFSTIPEDPGYPAAAWGRRVYTIAAMHAGPATGAAMDVLEPLRHLGDPLVDFSGVMPYVELQQLFDTVIPYGRHRCFWKSRYLDSLDDAAIDAMVEGNIAPPSPRTLASIWNLDGAVGRVPADATAFGDRSMRWMVSFDSIWDDARDDAANTAWSRAMWDTLGPWAAGNRVYLNFPGAAEGEGRADLVMASYGAGYERLAAIKRAWDPDNTFRFNQNIRPASD